ncbi:uncharacterized protein A1O9_06675 [Exophiala aquamarina CBS 119918]|uniref:Ketoreductase (KR) domain-containing protein n=1 Tax=Exophiala aquamarina CBS 119918 TaxID=1182545 RepID=A0A072PF68_9EURO|nr:uncharacterized protein A1O9_06675 [Exophiala aquamarina CBS 119918]KEF58749.1 hypothetical protein A1O9_06675 [Exophiala aquamarina CBS 119918]
MTFKPTVLITGTKAGIGKGLLKAYAARPGTLVVAAIRDGPDSPIAAELTSIPTAKDSKIIVVQYDAGSKSAAVDLVAYLAATWSPMQESSSRMVQQKKSHPS